MNSKNVPHHVGYMFANMFNTVNVIFFYNSSHSSGCVPILQSVGKKIIVNENKKKLQLFTYLHGIYTYLNQL